MKILFGLIVFGLSCLSPSASAQEKAAYFQKPTIAFSGFLDVYYGFDFNQPPDSHRPDFLFNHHRHNAVDINLGLLQAHVDGGKYQANLGLMVGTYPQQNLAHEPEWLRNIFAANVGIALIQDDRLWLDVGIFESHIGFESALSADNWTLTRSLVAENSPYYLAGAKLTWNPSTQWQLAALMVNGWQRIQRVSGSTLPSFGTQTTYTFSENARLNWSTFIGTDDPDKTRRMRYFSNSYGQFQLTEKIGLIAGIDVGFQQTAKGRSDHDVWFGTVLIARYAFSKTWAMAVRGEYYRDNTEVIVTTEQMEGFETAGFSANIDYNAHKNVFCRLEIRWLKSSNAIFAKNTTMSHNNVLLIGSIALRF
ncbi:porin [Nitrosococcus wardiae]|uniref:porin n=1 Tax=Nitrosococcus wardiae TaxID=1814290 RepID=UPI00197F4AA9|nr:porin [Nitrosococcus wardiae]